MHYILKTCSLPTATILPPATIISRLSLYALASSLCFYPAVLCSTRWVLKIVSSCHFSAQIFHWLPIHSEWSQNPYWLYLLWHKDMGDEASLALSPIIFYLIHSPLAEPASLPFLDHSMHALTSGFCSCLEFFFLGYIHASLPSLRSLLKGHVNSDTFPNSPL